MMPTIVTSTEIAHQRQLVENKRQGEKAQQLGSSSRFLDESITPPLQRECNIGNSEDTKVIIVKATTEPRRLLIDYTKQGRSMQHLGSCDISLLELKPDMPSVRSKSMSFDVIPSVLRVSFSSIDSSDSVIDDGELTGLTKSQDDDDETVEFFLKIPSRAARVRHSSVIELRELFQRQPKANKRGHGFIQRLLSEPPSRLRSTAVVASK